MGIKTYNPYTPSRRHMTGSDFSEITTSTPEKSLVVSLKKNAGRNNQGKITVRHRGGGSRRKYRIIDFKRRKTYNTYTPSRRHMTGSDFSEITTSTPEKSLVVSLKKNAGRNNQGKITVRHRGGGSRRKYRIIDFKRRKDGIPATVATIEYDPNRTANIALINYADGETAYILAQEGLQVGQKKKRWNSCNSSNNRVRSEQNSKYCTYQLCRW